MYCRYMASKNSTHWQANKRAACKKIVEEFPAITENLNEDDPGTDTEKWLSVLTST